MNLLIKRVVLGTSAIVAGASVAYLQLVPTADPATGPSNPAAQQSLQAPAQQPATLVAGPVERDSRQAASESSEAVMRDVATPADRTDDDYFAKLEAYEEDYDYDAYSVDEYGEEIAHDDWEAEDGDEFANDPWERLEY